MTDEERLARIDETELITETEDLLVLVKAAKPLTEEDVEALLRSCQE